jgi:hypothetical protein
MLIHNRFPKIVIRQLLVSRTFVWLGLVLISQAISVYVHNTQSRRMGIDSHFEAKLHRQ